VTRPTAIDKSTTYEPKMGGNDILIRKCKQRIWLGIFFFICRITWSNSPRPTNSESVQSIEKGWSNRYIDKLAEQWTRINFRRD